MTQKPTRKLYPVRLDLRDLDALAQIETDIGISRAEQVRRAIRAWLAQHKPRVTRAATKRKA